MRRLLVLALACLLSGPVFAKDYYVSANRGKGKKGSKEKPAKDLGNLLKKLQPGDTVHIAEGVYMGRGKCGAVDLTIPVSIIGGYDDTFSKRDPWGAHRTILSGDNLSKNWVSGAALRVDLMKYQGEMFPVLIDGIIVDHSGRNRYDNEKRHNVILRADPKTGKNPSPSLGALIVRASKSGKFDDGPRWKLTVQNCIVMNSVTTQACLSVSGYKGSECVIRNNLVINNSGFGLFAGTKFHGEGPPTFLVENNTVLFTWRHSINNETGSSFGSDTNTALTLRNNVFAFADRYGINNGKTTKNMLLLNNNIVGNMSVDYREGAMQIPWENVEDDAEQIHEDSEDNVQEEIKVPVSKEWAQLYARRVVVDREKIEGGGDAPNTPENQLRRMLGLPLQGGKVEGPNSPVWVHALSVDDAIAAAKSYGGRGCDKSLIK